ncbi:MAG: hypothetical protein QOI66_4206 [Myxococcales bacterium]|jgi:hypothetical protein|nr:hypothetical protein [Myxococcales bacterium]
MKTRLTRPNTQTTTTTKTTKHQHHAFRFVLLTAAVVAGCGSSASSNDADQFVGSWTFDSETITAMCSGLMPPPQDLSGKVLTLDRVSGSEVILNYSDNCKVAFTVSGSTATAKPKQTCQIATGQAGDQNLAVSSWTLTLDSPTAISTEQKGTALGGLCNISGSGKLSKTDAGGAG